MIEKYLIKNELSLKRWRRFKRVKRSVAATWLFLFFLFVSLTAEFWANSKPILFFYKGSVFFPVYRTYHPTLFDENEGLVTDYRKLSTVGKGWGLWPPIRWDPFESNLRVPTYPGAPSEENWFGTDDRGRDVFARLIYGFRYSIGFALLVWLFSYSLGIGIGATMGFFGGRVDLVGQRVVEVFESMPIMMILILLVSIFGASIELLALFSVAFGWMYISLYTRGEFLRLRKREFVEAARALGAKRGSQIFRHILPNGLAPVFTLSPFNLVGSISALAALDYLGLGLPAPTPSWGELLQQAEKNFSIAWWLSVFPSIAITLCLVALNLIGEGVRDAFDPRK